MATASGRGEVGDEGKAQGKQVVHSCRRRGLASEPGFQVHSPRYLWGSNRRGRSWGGSGSSVLRGQGRVGEKWLSSGPAGQWSQLGWPSGFCCEQRRTGWTPGKDGAKPGGSPSHWRASGRPVRSGHSQFPSLPARTFVGIQASEASRMEDATNIVRGLIVELSNLKYGLGSDSQGMGPVGGRWGLRGAGRD